MLGVYLSGTGNTKHCIEKLVKMLDTSAKILPLESENVIDAIKRNDTIVLGYPTQFSNAPYMVREFIISNADIWRGKQILCVATMGASEQGLFFIGVHTFVIAVASLASECRL